MSHLELFKPIFPKSETIFVYRITNFRSHPDAVCSRTNSIPWEKRKYCSRRTFFITIVQVISAGIIEINRFLQKANQQLLAQQQIITDKNYSLELLLQSQEKLLTEKEWLIKEIHHRIKNNLQVVASLLNSQLNYLDNKEARLAIKDSQNRIQSISLIHQKLFQSEDLNIVDIHAYIHGKVPLRYLSCWTKN